MKNRFYSSVSMSLSKSIVDFSSYADATKRVWDFNCFQKWTIPNSDDDSDDDFDVDSVGNHGIFTNGEYWKFSL